MRRAAFCALTAGRVERRRKPRVVRVAPHLPSLVPLQFSLQLLEAARQLVVEADLPLQLLLDALELHGLPLVTLVLSIDDPLLTLSEYLLLIGEFFQQPFDEVDRGLRPLIIELIQLLSGERNGEQGDGL